MSQQWQVHTQRLTIVSTCTFNAWAAMCSDVYTKPPTSIFYTHTHTHTHIHNYVSHHLHVSSNIVQYMYIPMNFQLTACITAMAERPILSQSKSSSLCEQGSGGLTQPLAYTAHGIPVVRRQSITAQSNMTSCIQRTIS